MTLFRFNRMAILIALCCCCCSSPSARMKTAAARPLAMRSSNIDSSTIIKDSATTTPAAQVEATSSPTPTEAAETRQRRDIDQQYQQGLESLHLSDNQPLKIVCDPPSSEALLRILGPAFNARYMAIDEPPEDNSPTTAATPQSNAEDDAEEDEEDSVGVETDGSYNQGRIIDQRDLKPLDFAVDSNHEQTIVEDGLFSIEVNMPTNGTLRRKRDTQELWKALRRNHYERFTPKRTNAAAKSGGSAGQPGSTGAFASAALPTPPWHCPSKVVWQNLGASYFPQFVRSIQCGRPGSSTPTSCWFGAYECAPSSFTMKILHRRSDFCYPVIEGNKTVRFEQKWTFVERAVPFCCSCQFKLYGKPPGRTKAG